MTDNTPLETLVGFAIVGLGAAALSSSRRGRRLSADAAARSEASSVSAARRLSRAAGTLAACVLADSAVEHYRGSFHNKTMFAPLVGSALSLAASAHGTTDPRANAHALRDGVFTLAIATGLVGTAFHVYNVAKRTGGFSWQNLFYAAPLGAPAALSLSGILGAAAERIRETRPGGSPRLLAFPAGRALAGIVGIGLLGTAGEAALLHLRGAYHNPAMWLPVTIPPIAGGLLATSAFRSSPKERRFMTWWLRLTVFLGCAGSAFHAYGVSRGMGGWRNWRQNLLNGPPIPAPPSFTGLALAGLAAVGLQREGNRGR